MLTFSTFCCDYLLLAQEIAMKHVGMMFHDLLTALNRKTISPYRVFFYVTACLQYIREMLLKVIENRFVKVRKFSIKDLSGILFEIFSIGFKVSILQALINTVSW